MPYLDLLDFELMDQLLLDPGRFKQIVDSPKHIEKPVIVDEVQKFPKILDVVSYHRLDWTLSYTRTKDDVEIDLVIERPGDRKLLVEIKSKNKVGEVDAKALETLGKDLDPKAEKWLLSNDRLEQTFGSSRALHWQKAMGLLFG